MLIVSLVLLYKMFYVILVKDRLFAPHFQSVWLSAVGFISDLRVQRYGVFTFPPNFLRIFFEDFF